ncbi:hypothetical protein BDK51DRAFT_32847, partial [Blyttiomyces helicus]
QATADPTIITELQSTHGIETITLAGYWFGGKITVLAGSDPTLTPSLRSITRVRFCCPLRVPLLFLNTELDTTFTPADRAAAFAALEKNMAEGFAFDVVDFEGVKHGFATCRDVTEERSLEDMRDVFSKSLEWIAMFAKE